jgi:hypothetical protein
MVSLVLTMSLGVVFLGQMMMMLTPHVPDTCTNTGHCCSI